MYGIEEYYYKVNRVFMKTLGLWPYQQPYIAQLQKVLFSSILFSFILVQCLACFTMKFSTDLFLKILSFLFPTLFATTKYCVFVIRADSVKLLLEEIRNDLTLLKNEVEIDIIKKYADNMRFITMVSIVSSYAGTVCYVMSQYLLPLLLNVLLPLNASRSLELIGITEYFVNREKFFWALLFHEVVTVYVGVTAVCSTGGTTIMYFLHSCALFKVASYRIENAIDKKILAIPDPTRKYLLQQKIVHAILIHRRAIKYIELWSSNFMVPFTILILIGVSSLSFNLFHLLQLVIVLDDPSEMYFAFLLITLHVGYMFALNYGGQEIQNHGVQLFEAIYNGLWYAAPLHTQKLLLFLMQKAAVKVTLVCGSIFVASLEGFVTLVSSAVSYFTVMYSTRQ
ncbi:hypothetical protein DMN91_009552 [Ooceraea biroi]|uniref:Odorant receptor n=2 Tax=Ooceraea biroi TaxID=2015173 RepID=A0A026VYR2_OOCBI|nr:uncharacterized protein LOC105285101 isoform X2 [Ooceraea biroi]EZA48938.1 hypothetical protein X777_12901 [Ooceraea biroi]RLU17319.1 hypothetical protein DMN91_009552 [Ooceraea biroi]